jgi:dTDP-glucose 4,6-dehydratase
MPDFILKTGSIGHRNLLNWAKDQKAKILFASTSEVYGDPKEHPQKESYFGNVNSYGPRSCYDEAKRFAEALTLAYRHQYGLSTRVVRIFNTYGPRMRPEDGRVIPNFFSQAKRGEALTIYGDGKQTRSLCYVSDMVDGIFKLMQSEIQDPVNMGNPEEYSILQLAEAVCKVVQKPFQVKHQAALPNDPQRRCPDISKARKELNWEPKIALAEGLAKTLNAF